MLHENQLARSVYKRIRPVRLDKLDSFQRLGKSCMIYVGKSDVRKCNGMNSVSVFCQFKINHYSPRMRYYVQ